MIQLIKDNPWIFSITAFVISLISVAFVVIDKVKVWGESRKIKNLKHDKAILYPLINLKVEDWHTKVVTKDGYNETTKLSARSVQLRMMIEHIDTTALKDKNIAEQVRSLHEKQGLDLIQPVEMPNGTFAIEFTPHVKNVIVSVRRYLAEVI